MRFRTKLVAGIVFTFLLITILPAGAQDKLDKNGIKRIMMTAFPELKEQDINISMIKRLNTRTKVNLEVEGQSAILYLKWQRHRNGARWWFERDAKRSLVYLGKAKAKSRTTAAKRTSDSKAKLAAAKPESRVETVKLDRKTGDVPAAVEQKSKPAETPKPSEKKPVEKAETQQNVVENKVEKKAPEKPPKPEAVVKTEKAEPAKAEPKPADTREQMPAEQTATKKETEPEKPAASEVAKEKPVETKKAADPEQQKVERSKAEPVKEAEPTPAETRIDTAPVTEPAAKQKQPAMDAMAAEPTPKPTPFVPVEVATGPLGTTTEFLASLVVTIRQGDNDQYENYLFRPSEMADDIQERDFQRGVSSWVGQMADIHERMKSVTNVSINKVILQRPQTEELEQITLTNLRTRIKSVDRVYTYVKINLTLDGRPAYISIGGLIRTDSGWRIGGKLDFVRQMSIQ